MDARNHCSQALNNRILVFSIKVAGRMVLMAPEGPFNVNLGHKTKADNAAAIQCPVECRRHRAQHMLNEVCKCNGTPSASKELFLAIINVHGDIDRLDIPANT